MSKRVKTAPSAEQQVAAARFGGLFRGRLDRRNANVGASSPTLDTKGDVEKAHAMGWCYGNLFRGWRSADKAAAAPPGAARVTSAAQTRKIGGYFFMYYVFNGKREEEGWGGSDGICVGQRDSETERISPMLSMQAVG